MKIINLAAATAAQPAPVAEQPVKPECPVLDLSSREGRLLATAADPLAFAQVYLRRHLGLPFSDIHHEWAEIAADFILQEPSRDAFIAPRDMGKSTWWFLIIPLWAAAHGHSKFIAAFADSARQAETHLSTFKNELDDNELLRADFPDLCMPKVRTTGVTVSDTQNQYVSRGGFAFAARGIDAAVLGLKIDENRPDIIIFDDIEPDEANYSVYQAKKRLGTVRDAILPMNRKARVIFVGTVTMPGGIMHQFVRWGTSNRSMMDETERKELEWIEEDGINPHYFAPIVKDANGEEHSCWPEKWSIEYLQKIRHTRPFMKNFLNKPMPSDGSYWCEEDITYGDPGGYVRTVLSIDPAVTTKGKSDFTGIAVVSGSRTFGGCVVRECWAVKLSGAALRKRALEIIEASQETDAPITSILVEVNQGGDLWKDQVFHDMPVKVRVITQSVKKEIRAAQLLSRYQRGKVIHLKRLASLEEQMLAYPDVLHDDMIDAVGSAVANFAKPPKQSAPSGRAMGYA